MTMGANLRKPRINLRLSDRNLFDDMQIFAHSQGLTLPAWAKATLKREMARSEIDDVFALQSLKSLLTIQTLIEEEHSKSEVDAARQKARDFIKQVKRRDDQA